MKNPDLGAKSMTLDFAGLMQEPPGGANYGRSASSETQADERHVGLSVDDAQTHEFLQDGGWTILTRKDGARAGLKAHRGVVAEDEHVDAGALLAAVERELGFTIEDVRSVYRQGRKSAEQAELRARIDARLLGLSRSGASMALLGRLLGFQVGSDAHCEAIDNALARARAAEASAA